MNGSLFHREWPSSSQGTSTSSSNPSWKFDWKLKNKMKQKNKKNFVCALSFFWFCFVFLFSSLFFSVPLISIPFSIDRPPILSASSLTHVSISFFLNDSIPLMFLFFIVQIFFSFSKCVIALLKRGETTLPLFPCSRSTPSTLISMSTEGKLDPTIPSTSSPSSAGITAAASYLFHHFFFLFSFIFFFINIIFFL